MGHPAHPPSGLPARIGSLALGIGVLLCLGFGVWGLWRVWATRSQPQVTAEQWQAQQRRIDELEQQAVSLQRSDQISRDANLELQGTLAERDEEISALRADVAFYERLVGPTAQRRGLTVHALRLQAQNDQAWHFTATLSQTLGRSVNAGQLRLRVEGTENGKLRRLDWSDLRQQADAPGVAYSFKYFQRLEGDLLLPPGFQPVRIAVRLQPRGGTAVEQSFAWNAVVAPEAAPDGGSPEPD
ncbi:hypothetical protein CSC70_03700 [Pseudoxanthomonas kalamensis DSM 18571]|uniref:DUF6776 family protein n=1 Tax=Pseudoxanthomonas kalamensis TaxID=289483 RepID=UPI001390B0CA|nr:DUF6776 family protein [Pseudoxanthomonas kalamensis]KAF1712615.1 hypothetical protein CSC70_03700 [Pseudoxanthomonas kalamensis DSM 18571]